MAALLPLLLTLLLPQDRLRLPENVEELDDGLRRALAQLDPALGGWEGEVLMERVSGPLEALRAGWAGERAAGAVAREIAVPEVRVGAAPRLETVHEGTAFRVRRGAGEGEEAAGHAALASLLADLGDLGGDAPRRAKWKVVETRPEDGRGGLRLRVELAADGTQAVLELDTEWTWTGAAETPRLAAITCVSAEGVDGPPGGLLRDVAGTVLEGEAWSRQLVGGVADWRQRLDRRVGVGLLGHVGVAVGDVNGDGLEDLYLCQPGGLPNLLYLHGEDGRAREVGRAAGVDVIDYTPSALFVDLDGDAHLDLVLAVPEAIAVFAGDGAGRFAPRLQLEVTGPTSISAADADGDGLLDLFVCAYVSPYDGLVTPIPYHDATNGATNKLFVGRGDFVFEDASEVAGFASGPPRFSFAAAWEDYDRDGDQDLYVANDFGRNELWRNDGGRFEDVAAALGVEDLSAGMGVTWADVDGDGWQDLYISNMFSSAGNRIAFGRHFRPGAADEELGGFRRHARGNSLFRNLGGEAFVDVTADSGASMGRWAWGGLFTELDNDGRPDLLVPNGFLTNERSDDL